MLRTSVHCFHQGNPEGRPMAYLSIYNALMPARIDRYLLHEASSVNLYVHALRKIQQSYVMRLMLPLVSHLQSGLRAVDARQDGHVTLVHRNSAICKS
jgi:hypothetical protein